MCSYLKLYRLFYQPQIVIYLNIPFFLFWFKKKINKLASNPKSSCLCLIQQILLACANIHTSNSTCYTQE